MLFRSSPSGGFADLDRCFADGTFLLHHHLKPLSSSTQNDEEPFLISYPDFSECISDGESVEQALKNGTEALKATIAALKAKDMPVPAANSGGVASGKHRAGPDAAAHSRGS